MESKGSRLSRTKTEYMMCGFSTTRCEEEEVSLDVQVVPQKDTVSVKIGGSRVGGPDLCVLG